MTRNALIPGVCGAAAAAMGLAVLAGWWLDVAALKSVLPGAVSMKANTALAFVLAGAALALLSRAPLPPGRARAGRALGLLVAAIGALTLCEFLFGWQLGIDELLFRDDPQAAGTTIPGRMAPTTALSFVAIGLALLAIEWEPRPPVRAAELLALLAGSAGLISLAEYATGHPILYGFDEQTRMALHTAAAFLVLSAGVLLARPAQGVLGAIRARRLSLRARLLGLVFLASAPLLAILLYSASEHRRDAIEQARADLQNLSRQARDRLVQAVGASEQLLYSLAQISAVARPEASECVRVLGEIVSRARRYTSIVVVDVGGQTICESIERPSPISVADRAYFHEMRKSRRFVIGDPVVGRVSGIPTLPLGIPLLGAAGDFRGAVLTGLDLNWFGRQFDQSRPDLNLIFTIWGEDGSILYRYPDGDRWIGKRPTDTGVARAVLSRRSDATAMEAPGLTGENTLYAVIGMENVLGNRLAISVGVSKAELLAEPDRRFARSLGVFGIVFALVLAGAWAVAEYAIRRRVVALVKVSDRLAAGELSARSGLAPGEDEIGRLAASLDGMAAAMQHQVEEIRLYAEELSRTNRALRMLSECNQALVRAVDEPQLLQDICDRIVRFGGFRFAWIGYAEDDAAKSVRPVARAGDVPPDPEALRITWADEPRGRGPTGSAIRTGEVFVANDIATDVRAAPWWDVAAAQGFASCLGLPLEVEGRCIGALTVFAAERDAFHGEELPLLQELAADLAYGIRAQRLQNERKRAEREIRDLNASLERRVAERTQQLEEASRAKSDFLANMSHELRTPLNAIIGFSEMLKDGVLGELEAKQRGFIGDIFNAGTHLLALINDILDLSKVEAGTVQLEHEAVDLLALLKSSLLIVKEKAAAHRVRLETDIAPGLAPLLADERKLKQIVYNLLANAVKFTPDGGAVTLSARRCTRAAMAMEGAMPARLLPLAPGEGGDFLEISVSDTGVGIAEEHLGRLFEPFVQVDSSPARRAGGTGLGLSIVRRLAELHGGTVGVASLPGAGSRFSVWLPYRAPAGEPLQEQPAGAAAPAAAPASPLALVIEDDDRAAELIEAQLRAEGFATMRAATAEEGLVRAGKRRPQLITLDIFLPAMDGWEFMRRLRAEPKLADTPVVIITVSEDLDRGLALGARRVLQKPFAREQLIEALAGLIERRPGGEPARVLVVDDNPKAVELVAAALQAQDYRVLRAYGGAEAIEAARRAVPDLVILDLVMPEVSGFEVAKTLRESEATARIPILVLTAKDLTAGDRARLNGCVSAILAKSSFSRSELLAELRRALPLRTKD